MSRRPLVAANWKMHGLKAFAADLCATLVDGLAGESACDVLICPPFVYLAQVQQALRGSDIRLGAQNMHQQEQGAFTGEISAPMLLDHDCSHVLIGHSERRELFAESSELTALKVQSAVNAGLVPVLCVGESGAQREAGTTNEVIRGQLQAVLDLCNAEVFAKAVVAYEPVWAIGTGLTATPEQAQDVHAMIRTFIAGQPGGEEIAAELKILYGGSVKAANAAALFAQPDIDGALVGGASLVAEDFLAICRAAA